MDFSRSIRVHCAGMDCLLKNDVDVKKWSHPGLVGGRSCRGEEVSKALSSRSPFLYHSQFSHTGISSSSSHNFLVSILPLTSMLQFCAAHIYFSHSPLPEEKARVHFTSQPSSTSFDPQSNRNLTFRIFSAAASFNSRTTPPRMRSSLFPTVHRPSDPTATLTPHTFSMTSGY